MNKQNYEQMSTDDLIAYIKLNRTDDEAIRELFVNRRNPNATKYPAPLDAETIRLQKKQL